MSVYLLPSLIKFSCMSEIFFRLSWQKSTYHSTESDLWHSYLILKEWSTWQHFPCLCISSLQVQILIQNAVAYIEDGQPSFCCLVESRETNFRPNFLHHGNVQIGFSVGVYIPIKFFYGMFGVRVEISLVSHQDYMLCYSNWFLFYKCLW